MSKLLTPTEFAQLKGVGVTTIYTRLNIPQEDGSKAEACKQCDIEVTLEDGVYKIDPSKNKHVKFRKYTNKKAMLKRSTES